MNEHPRRALDTISSQIEALGEIFNSRYPVAEFMSQLIVYSETLMLDLVFPMNEHPRRAVDVILRQSEAPIELFNSR